MVGAGRGFGGWGVENWIVSEESLRLPFFNSSFWRVKGASTNHGENSSKYSVKKHQKTPKKLLLDS
jgi:hypothetical protein